MDLEDIRTGKNSQYAVSDAAMSAFGVFFMQEPSFLAQQKAMIKGKGQANIFSLFLVNHVPSDNQIRNLLDPVSPQQLASEFEWVYSELRDSGKIDALRDVGGTLLIAIDGMTYFESTEIHCPNCLSRAEKSGKTHYYHSALTPVIVKPGCRHVVALMPEQIQRQDGQEKQDCERNAAKRWLNQHRELISKQLKHVTFLGDDLYSNQPFCQAVVALEQYFLCVAKPQSHEGLYKWVAEVEQLNRLHQHTIRKWTGKYTEISQYRWATEGPLRSDTDTMLVNWVELRVYREDTGEQLYYNTWVTNHDVTQTNVAELAGAGRARWKVENENNNVLKNNGYHLEHSFGHGKQHLATLLFTLNVLAFLIHTAQDMVESPYHLIRVNRSSRREFFEELRALTRLLYFESWDALFRLILEGLEVVIPAGLFETNTS